VLQTVPHKSKLSVNIGNVFCTYFFSENFHCSCNKFLHDSTRIIGPHLFSN
jgi:hypothetical protein